MKKLIAYLCFIFFIQISSAQDSICFYKKNHEQSYYKNITNDTKYSSYIIHISKTDTIIKKCNIDSIRFYNVKIEIDTFLLCIKKGNKIFYNSITAKSLYDISYNKKNIKLEFQLLKKKDSLFFSLYGGYVSSGLFLFRQKNTKKYFLIKELIDREIANQV